MVFGVCAVVGLEDLCEEEDPVALGGEEDGGLFGLHTHALNLNQSIPITYPRCRVGTLCWFGCGVGCGGYLNKSDV